MKRILYTITIIFIIAIIALIYFFYGIGADNYKKISWQGMNVNVPNDYRIVKYKSKGWDVYSLRKRDVLVIIAEKAEIDIYNLPRNKKKVLYKKEFVKPYGSIFYIFRNKSDNTVVYSLNVENTSVYLSVSSISLIKSLNIMNNILKFCNYREHRIISPNIELPISIYYNDFVYLIIAVISFLLIFFLIYFSGKKPKSIFEDEIIFDEEYVNYTDLSVAKRKSSYCYLVLFRDRLAVYNYMKPVMEISRKDASVLSFKKNSIIIKHNRKNIIIKPSKFEDWQKILKGRF